MKICPPTETLLAYLEDRLADAQCAEIERHLADDKCASCKEEMERLTASESEQLPIAPILPTNEVDESTLPFEEEPTGTGDWPRIPGYKVLGELGGGGMGIVYKAKQLHPPRLVALKMIRADAVSAEALARFRIEYESVSRLTHPNIVPIYAVGEHEAQPFFLMEFAKGGNLQEKLAGKPMAARPAAELTAKLARAVQHAHEHGVLHRDLKPANVVLSTDDIPKITDFGLAKQMDRAREQPSAEGNGILAKNMTRRGTVMGTPEYMAPEQARGEIDRLDERVDVYALGAVLYKLLTGRPPFQGTTPEDTLTLVQSREVESPRVHNRRTDRALEAICLKCLAKEPEHRYASAAALAEDLEGWLRGRCPSHCRWPIQTRWFLWRHSRAVSAAALIVLATIVTLGFLYFTDANRAMRLAERKLAEGQSVTLIDKGSGPPWGRVLTLENESKVARSRDGEFSFQASQLGLLLLIADPQREHYRLIAEIRHDTAAADEAEVGLFCLYNEVDTDEHQKVHCFCGLGFNDLSRPVNGEFNFVKPFRQQYCENTQGVDHRPRSEFGTLKFKPALPVGGGGPGRWRKLTLEVAPDTIRGFWASGEGPDGSSDQPVGELSLETLRRRVQLLETFDAQKRGQKPVLETPYKPRSPLGLYVYKGSASARRVVIEPLGD
jgi:serine/threonine-protein kinase